MIVVYCFVFVFGFNGKCFYCLIGLLFFFVFLFGFYLVLVIVFKLGKLNVWFVFYLVKCWWLYVIVRNDSLIVNSVGCFSWFSLVCGFL